MTTPHAPPEDPSSSRARAPDRASSRRRPGATLLAIAAIAALVGGIALAFAYTAGWIGPQRLTPQRMTDAIEAATGTPYPGFRRAHSKGLCVAGTFTSTGLGAALSKAQVFAAGATVPVLGRMSIGGGNPHGADADARVRSMALQLRTPDGEEWRTAMNSFPFFVVKDAQGFYDQVVASQPDPATGKPDPARMAAFRKAHPEAAAFADWAKSAPWSTSFANTQYNGVNTFRFVDAQGQRHDVRWSMRPQAPFAPMSPEQRKAASPDALAQELNARLATGPVRWDMVVTVAKPGDPVNDPSKQWPADREQIVVGTLALQHAQPQATGPCRDLNFDPLILPSGIEGSDDPILAARSAVYSVSFNRRQREIANGSAADALGSPRTGTQRPEGHAARTAGASR